MKSKVVSKAKKINSISIFNRLEALVVGVLGLVAVTVATYWQTLNYPFQFDDLLNITKNYSIRAFDWKLHFLSSSRWIGELSNKLNFQIGHFQPWNYRFINLTVHCLTGIVFFCLVYAICKNEKDKSFLKQYCKPISLLASALFLLHPVQTQTVNYAIQARLEGLAALLGLTSLLLMFHYMISPWKSRKSWIFLALASLMGFISCGTKEIVIVVPFLAIILDWFFVAKMDFANFKKRLVGHVIFSSAIFLCAIYYLGTRFLVDTFLFKMVAKNNRGNIVSHGVLNQIPAWQFLISQFKVVLHYVFIFFAPFFMSVEYDWKLAKNIWQLDVIIPFFILALFVGLCAYWIIRRENKLFTFCSSWFLLCLAPRCSLIPSAELVCDYKTYLASCGILFLFAIVLVKMWDLLVKSSVWLKNNDKPAIAVATLSCLFVLSISTSVRSKVWSTSELFWADVVHKAPNKARGQNNYGVALCESGKFAVALDYFKRAIELDKNYCDPWSNIAVAYSMLGKMDDSIAALEESVRIFPNYAEAHNNLGAVYIGSNDLEKAEGALNRAIELRPHYGKAHLNLGRVHTKRGNDEDSWQCYKRATELDLDNTEGFAALGAESLRLCKYEEAVEALERAVALGAKNVGIYMNLAGAYCNTENAVKGERIYADLHRKCPNDQSITYNLALCMYNRDDFDSAKKALSGIRFDASCPERVVSLLSECIEKSDGIEQARGFLEEFCSKDYANQHKTAARMELSRVRLQEKMNQNNGSIEFKDLQEALSLAKMEENSEQNLQS